MKFVSSIIFALVLSVLPSQAQAATKVSLGGVATTPLALGGFVSWFPDDCVSLDGKLTTATVDVGLTGHLPIVESVKHRHSLLVSGQGGYIHNRPFSVYPRTSYHTTISAGYGYESLQAWDIRVQLGADLFGSDPLTAKFHSQVMVGRFF